MFKQMKFLKKKEERRVTCKPAGEKKKCIDHLITILFRKLRKQYVVKAMHCGFNKHDTTTENNNFLSPKSPNRKKEASPVSVTYQKNAAVSGQRFC